MRRFHEIVATGNRWPKCWFYLPALTILVAEQTFHVGLCSRESTRALPQYLKVVPDVLPKF